MAKGTTTRITPKQRAEQIRAAIEAKGYTPTSFARKANITYRSLKKILDGTTTDLLSSTVEKLSPLDLPRHVLTSIQR